LAFPLTFVNVIEIISSVPEQIVSFKDNPAGNKEAEALFTKIAKENGASMADMESYLEDGVFAESMEYYGVYLTHSS